MFAYDWFQLLFLIGLVACCIPIVGSYMAKVFQGEKTLLHPLLAPLENFSYRMAGIQRNEEMGWKSYLKCLLLFNLVGCLTLFIILILQDLLPLNPQKFGPLSWDLALNTAISFTSNTNWQAYAGETTLSYGSQMWGLAVQNFLSAASGNAALLALIRGICKKTGTSLGNFWVDLVRTVVYLLLPLSLILALLLISQGVIQTLSPYITVSTLEKAKQIIPLGPVASQIAIKQLGTNGGGFFGVNSAHPFENPTGLSNFLELFAIMLLPASAPFMYGLMTGYKKHAWLLLLAMFLFWIGGLGVSLYAAHVGDPIFKTTPYLEGKEVRLGIFNSHVWSVTTTAISNGSVNASLDSLPPLAGGVALFNMMLGELIFGGVGVGLCSMLMFVFLTIFLAGLMIGRSPEFMGKKIEKWEMQWVSLAIIAPAAFLLIGSGLSIMIPSALSKIDNRGPHGLSAILYAFASASGNNGSAFAGLQANTLFYNLTLSACMLLGRLCILVPSVAIGGGLLQKKVSATFGLFSIDSFIFFSLLVVIIFIFGALTFFPALCLGPLAEHFLMLKGRVF